MNNSKGIRAAAVVLVAVFLLSAAASAACGRWVVRETTDYLSDPTFDVLSGQAGEAKENGGQAQNETAGDGDGDSLAESAAESAYRTNSTNDISGRWIMDIESSLANRLDMMLVSNEGTVQGYGNLTSSGVAMPARATGQVNNDSIRLAVVLSPPGETAGKRLSMNLVMNNGSLYGEYTAYDMDEPEGAGNVTAWRIGI